MKNHSILIFLRTIAVTVFRNLNILNHLALENMTLRHQISVLKRSSKRPVFQDQDRLFWILLSGLWKNWKQAVVIIQPETVVKWHRQGFKAYWKFKSRPKRKPGRPKTALKIRRLVKEMAHDNPLWGAPRIHGELIKLGFDISERTISNLLRKIHRKPPSQTWRTFLKNHVGKVSVDFFTVPTATFRVLYVFVILSNDRRRIVHFNVTTNPTARWTAQLIVEAFPWETAPKYLMRDRDAIYGSVFRKRLKHLGISEVISAPQSPWQNPFVERVIGTIRRECLDHLIIWNERHLRKTLTEYICYYNNDRTHYNLAKDSPHTRKVQVKPDKNAAVIKLPRLGGLHHRYEWQKAA